MRGAGVSVADGYDPSTEDRLLTLAGKLRAEGRHDDAIAIFEHLVSLRPGNADALRGLARALGGQGRTLEALARLLGARQVMSDPTGLIDEVREQSTPAVARFNAHLAAGEIELAERYAAALAALVPLNAPMLAAALACNQALGRAEQALHYARALIAIEPANPAALAVLGEAAPAPAVLLTPDVHPLIQLRDLHDEASLLLCSPLGEAEVARLAALLDAARDLQVPVEPGTEWFVWERHYRLLMEAVDLAAIQGPTPAADPELEVEYATAAGKALTAAAVRKAADGLDARAVFFAAADEAYVDPYARWYALSVLKYADVSAMVVIHVIGGFGRLKAIAARVGIDDPRLVFAADRFIEADIRTLCYDAPPKGLIAKPVAHLQSVRFQRLGSLLALLERPVFVSDIDLLLQRGVADLLERCAGDDVVFNENTLNTNAGSRLTANLMLVNPTATAHQMLRFLGHYLTDRLSRAQVTRWIDQVALIVTRHHLAFNAPDAALGYFDTDSDINNVMYRAYQAHPFRFLSLFHGFDTSTLEGDARAAGEGATGSAPQKKRRK